MGLRPRRAILGGLGLQGLQGWERRKTFFLDAIAMADEVKRGDSHWLAVQFMRSQGVDRVAAALLLESFEDADMNWLKAFTMPTLVMCGSEDHDNGSPQDLVAALPEARYAEVPGTHMSSVTRPQFGEAIAAFLSE
jgi:pimeloyl-ACP methyl ester carboxylesterase